MLQYTRDVDPEQSELSRGKSPRTNFGTCFSDVLPMVLIDTVQDYLPLSTRIKVMRVVCKAFNSLKGEAHQNYSWAKSCNTPIMKRCAVRCFGTSDVT